MGGMGSGRGTRLGKDTTSSYSGLDVRYLQRHGMLRAGASSSISWSRCGKRVGSIRITAEANCIRLSYRHCRYGDNWKDENYLVVIEWTSCNYGGKRAWFRCPGSGCGRRVAVLYGGGLFACRHCHNLNYQSQHEHAWERSLSRYANIREKLGVAPGLGFPDRPKGMHWRTYRRLRQQADRGGVGKWPNWISALVNRSR